MRHGRLRRARRRSLLLWRRPVARPRVSRSEYRAVSIGGPHSHVDSHSGLDDALPLDARYDRVVGT